MANGSEMVLEGIETFEVNLGEAAKGGTPSVVTPEVPAEFSGKPGDLKKDLAMLQQEMTPKPQMPPVVEQVQTVEPGQPATAPVTPVPDKFKAPDGTVSEEKVVKSTVHAEEALAKYAEIERKLRQKQNEVAALKQGAPIPQPPAQVPANVQLSPFEIQVAQDYINESAALGYQMPQAQAIAQARVQIRLYEAAQAARMDSTESLRQRLDDADSRRELESIAANDPWVLSLKGIEALGKIRQERQHVNHSATPWTAAYREYLADTVLQQRLSGQVQTPTPQAKAAQPPATPVNAVTRVSVKPTGPDFGAMNSDQITAYATALDPKAEAAFWKSRGLKF